MMAKPELVYRDLAIAAGLGLMATLAAAFILASVASPKDFNARLAKVDADLDSAARAARPSRTAPGFAPDAICTGGVANAQQALITSLTGQASQSKLTLSGVDITPASPMEGAKLTAVSVRFVAAGPYEGVMSLLDQLSRSRPILFVDSMDLVTRDSSVALTFSGRLFCAA